jgi:hypothetical protein
MWCSTVGHSELGKSAQPPINPAKPHIRRSTSAFQDNIKTIYQQVILGQLLKNGLKFNFRRWEFIPANNAREITIKTGALEYPDHFAKPDTISVKT